MEPLRIWLGVYGLETLFGGDPRGLIEVARHAEAAGVDQINITDHVVMGALPRIAGKLVIFAAAGGFVIWRFNILGLRDFAGGLAARLVAKPIGQTNARVADRSWQ